MIPQIFISSTFYDLKYAREDLGAFVRNYGFEPILFENGDVGYAPGDELDVSCYRTMQASDMSILIVGGKYGSPASGEKKDDSSFNEYLSVTRKEFEAAINANIPIYVFIEEAVQNEYQLYKRNKNKFENKLVDIDFNAVDSINVFRFIDNIFLFRIIPVFSFKEIQQIKSILKKQWADMFKSYLRERKLNVPLKDIEPSINEIYVAIQSMEVMLQNVGKKVIGTETIELKSVLDNQLIENIAGNIANTFEFMSLFRSDEQIRTYLIFFIERLYLAEKEGILEYPFSDNLDDITKFFEFFEYDDVFITQVKRHIQFEENHLSDIEEYKEVLVQRLMNQDYLRKMKFL